MHQYADKIWKLLRLLFENFTEKSTGNGTAKLHSRKTITPEAFILLKLEIASV